jgi:type II secretory pathway predicted ATPase ExeA
MTRSIRKSFNRTLKTWNPFVDNNRQIIAGSSVLYLRLLFEDFPRSHILVLIAQPPLLQSLALSINEEIRSRITYSVTLPRLAPETIDASILSELDRAGLGHNTFALDALALIVRSGEGLLRPHQKSVPGLADRSGPRPNPHRRFEAGQPRPRPTSLEKRL